MIAAGRSTVEMMSQFQVTFASEEWQPQPNGSPLEQTSQIRFGHCILLLTLNLPNIQIKGLWGCSQYVLH
jgi:hypothetical protein